MKKGNVDVRKGINQTYRISYADTLLFVLHEDSVKDLHSLLSELLETETKTSNLGFIRQYLGEVPPERRFTAKELWEVFNTFAPLMSKETEKKLVEAIKGIETETVKEECRCRSGELKTGGKWASWSKDNCPVHPDKSPFDKEEPTTPEKKCCDCFGKEPISLGVVLGGGEFKCQCKCHKEKLPSERIFEIREKGGKEVLPSNGEEYYVMPIAKAIMMYLDEQHKKK